MPVLRGEREENESERKRERERAIERAARRRGEARYEQGRERGSELRNGEGEKRRRDFDGNVVVGTLRRKLNGTPEAVEV